MALVAQELNHPLAPVRLATAMLGRASSDEPLLPRVQSIIEQQAQHMSRLVDAVHDVARAEAGTLQLEREDVDLIGVVDAAVSGCRASMDARQQHFSAQLPGTAVKLLGDRARLAQIVGNLLDNASKYTPDGGEIRLSLEVAGRCRGADRVRQRHRHHGAGVAGDLRTLRTRHRRPWASMASAAASGWRWCVRWSRPMAERCAPSAKAAGWAAASSSRWRCQGC